MDIFVTSVTLWRLAIRNMSMKNETKNRLLRALALRGHTYFSGPGMRIFFILQIILQLYLLEPVFIYYFKGVPPETSLEVITGTWRTEGQLGSNSNGLTAPKYFVDTEQGSREVHCGFPVQRRPCSIFGIASPPLGIQVSVKYDNYFEYCRLTQLICQQYGGNKFI